METITFELPDFWATALFYDDTSSFEKWSLFCKSFNTRLNKIGESEWATGEPPTAYLKSSIIRLWSHY